MCKLSIIVPIYNVQDYLHKCVDSLLAQDLSKDEYEIILVDDGATDMSGTIADEYAEKHSNIRVIHQSNSGLSEARNTGIKASQGKYLMFVDSDDYLERNVLGSLIKQVESEDLDVLRFDYQNVRLKTENNGQQIDDREYEVFEPNKTARRVDEKNEVVSGDTYLNTRMGYACYAVQWIIRRTIVSTFARGIHFEDVEWLPRMMLNAKRVNSTTVIVYNYLVRQGSITKTQGDKAKILKNVEDSMTIIDQYSNYRRQYPESRWLRNMQSSMACGVLTTVAMEFYSQKAEYIERLRKLNVFPLSIADQGRTYIRRARIINFLGPRFYCALMYLRK